MFEEARNMGPIKSRQRQVTNWNMGGNGFEYEYCFVLSYLLPFSFYLLLYDILLLYGKITISTGKIIVVFLAAASEVFEQPRMRLENSLWQVSGKEVSGKNMTRH